MCYVFLALYILSHQQKVVKMRAILANLNLRGTPFKPRHRQRALALHSYIIYTWCFNTESAVKVTFISGAFSLPKFYVTVKLKCLS